MCVHVLDLMNGRLCFKLLMRCAAGLTERFCSLLVRELFTGVTAPTGDFSAPMQMLLWALNKHKREIKVGYCLPLQNSSKEITSTVH